METIFEKEFNARLVLKLAIVELWFTVFVVACIAEVITGSFHSNALQKIVIISTISILLILLWVFILDLIIWQFKGLEIIAITNETLVLKKRGRIFTSKKTINLFEIEDILIKETKTTIYARFRKILGISDGEICIKYLGCNVSIGQDISDEEAIQCVEEVNKARYQGCFPKD